MYFHTLSDMVDDGAGWVCMAGLALGLSTKDWMLPAYLAGIYLGVIWLAVCFFAINFVISDGIRKINIFAYNCYQDILASIVQGPLFAYAAYGIGYWASIGLHKILAVL